MADDDQNVVKLDHFSKGLPAKIEEARRVVDLFSGGKLLDKYSLRPYFLLEELLHRQINPHLYADHNPFVNYERQERELAGVAGRERLELLLHVLTEVNDLYRKHLEEKYAPLERAQLFLKRMEKLSKESKEEDDGPAYP